MQCSTENALAAFPRWVSISIRDSGKRSSVQCSIYIRARAPRGALTRCIYAFPEVGPPHLLIYTCTQSIYTHPFLDDTHILEVFLPRARSITTPSAISILLLFLRLSPPPPPRYLYIHAEAVSWQWTIRCNRYVQIRQTVTVFVSWNWQKFFFGAHLSDKFFLDLYTIYWETTVEQAKAGLWQPFSRHFQ